VWPLTQEFLRRGGQAASCAPNAQLLPLLEEAAGHEGFGERIFGDEAALAGLSIRVHEARMRRRGAWGAGPFTAPRRRARRSCSHF
jgi:hypothetical protein